MFQLQQFIFREGQFSEVVADCPVGSMKFLMKLFHDFRVRVVNIQQLFIL